MSDLSKPRLHPRPTCWSLIIVCLAFTACRPSLEEYVRSIERVAEISARYKDNCNQMGRALKNYLKREGYKIRNYQNYIRLLPIRDRERIDKHPLGERVRHSMAQLIPGYEHCLTDKSVRDAYNSIWEEEPNWAKTVFRLGEGF